MIWNPLSLPYEFLMSCEPLLMGSLVAEASVSDQK